MTIPTDTMLDTIALIHAFVDNDHEAIDLLLPAGQPIPHDQAVALTGLTAAIFVVLSEKTGLPVSDLLRAATQIIITTPEDENGDDRT